MFPFKVGNTHENTVYSRIPFLQQDREHRFPSFDIIHLTYGVMRSNI